MADNITKDNLRYIIERLIDRANETLQEKEDNPEDEFVDGKSLAYYEMLDIIKTELKISTGDLKSFGIDVDLDKLYL